MRIVFVADFFVEDGLLGGGELNNDEVIRILSNFGHEILKINSSQVTPKFLHDNKDVSFIIANFIALARPCLDILTREVKYIIYEHDHKYLTTRDPATYKDFKAPSEHIINYDFYKNALAVLCQSAFHANIIKKNLNLNNIVNLSGNLWSLESLERIKTISKKQKKNRCSILDSNIQHKNTVGAIKYCKHKDIEYELVKSDVYYNFLEKLGSNESFVFFPQTPETLSRVVVEARMMGMKTITNNLIGAIGEPWFESKGIELIEIFKKKRDEIPNIILNYFGFK
tara:strand:+ start:1957 stop:2805 length:849 start_codon:yes stop_codon:yes gene_type:complete